MMEVYTLSELACVTSLLLLDRSYYFTTICSRISLLPTMMYCYAFEIVYNQSIHGDFDALNWEKSYNKTTNYKIRKNDGRLDIFTLGHLRWLVSSN